MTRFNQTLLVEYAMAVAQHRALIAVASTIADRAQFAAMLRQLDARRAAIHDALLKSAGVTREDTVTSAELALYLDELLERKAA